MSQIKITALFFIIICQLFMLNIVNMALASNDDKTDELEIIWSAVDHYTWVYESGDVPIPEFTFILNNEKNSKRINLKKYQNSLHVIFPLNYEENTLEVKHLGASLFKKEIHYYPLFESELVSEDAILEPFHSRDQESKCSGTSCHRMTVEPTDLKPTQIKQQICFQCHSHKFDNFKSTHKPAALEWRCLQCHSDTFQESEEYPDIALRFTIEESLGVATLCYKCHKKLKTHIESHNYIHGPIGMKGCTMCHSPHGSNFPRLLHQEANALCIDCHNAQKMIKKPVVHQILKQKGCIVCHHPHSSNYPFQLISDITKLCYECHPNISRMKNNHPVQGHPVFIKEKPPSKKFTVSCIKCHSPHSSDYDKLLPEAEMMMLCVNCHQIGTI